MVPLHIGFRGLLAAAVATGFVLLMQVFAFGPLGGLADASLLLIPAVILASWSGGTFAGLAATALGALVECYALGQSSDPPTSIAPLLARVLPLVVAGSLVSVVVSRLRLARERADGRRRELEIEIERLRRLRRSTSAPASN